MHPTRPSNGHRCLSYHKVQRITAKSSKKYNFYSKAKQENAKATLAFINMSCAAISFRNRKA